MIFIYYMAFRELCYSSARAIRKTAPEVLIAAKQLFLLMRRR